MMALEWKTALLYFSLCQRIGFHIPNFSRYRLMLVAAPAGSGKTILSSTLTQGDLTTTWVALDSTDDDLPIFVALLVAALRSQLRDEGQSILSFLQTVPNAQEKTSQLATIFINNLTLPDQSPVILILDDYHAITDPAIHKLIAYLLDYLPPSLRLVITTRHDPPLPGTSVFLPKGIPHTFSNSKTQPAKALVVLTPAGLEGLFADVEPLVIQSEPDITAILAV